jgi:hypothetical protein
LMARRRCGAVAITEKSRMPSSDIASVRGMGVAGQREDVDLRAQPFQLLLLAHAEAVLLSR